MKKILLSLALLATVFSARATDYTDQLSVAINGVAAPAQTTTITVDDKGDGTYDFSLKDFRFGEVSVGDITLNSVRGVDQNGVVYLAASEPVHVNLGGVMPLDLTVTLRGELRDNKSRLYASMDIPVTMLNQTVNVVFGRGYQLPNSGFEDYQDYTVDIVDMTTYTPTTTTVKEPLYWHSFASATGDYQAAAVAFANPFTWQSPVVRNGAAGSSSLMLTSSNVMGFQIANGTVTTGRMNCGSMTADDPANHAEMVVSDDSLDAHGDPYYVLLNGQPDSLTLWYAFKQGTPVAEHPYATVDAVITDGTYYQDPEDSATVYNNKSSRAQDKQIATTFTEGTPVWKRLSVPFSVIDKNVDPKAILVTISTNADAGQGSIDTLYVDDVNLVYNDPQNVDINFGTANGIVTPDDITVTYDGALGARVVKDLKQDGDDVIATVTVYNGDLTKEIAKKSHVYKNTTTGISGVSTTADKAIETYDISGRRVDDNARHGVFIIRTTGGKTVKVVRK